MKKTGERTETMLKNMKIIQRNDFQNFTLDSVLIGDFVKINRKSKKILDIGTGCGVIALILASRSKAEIVGVELQEIMADIAKENVQNNEFEDRVKIMQGDIKNYREIFKRDEFDIVVTNPPYFEFKGDINQINDLDQLAKARHNVDLSLGEIIEASAFVLKNGGSFNMVFRVERLVEVFEIMRKYRLEPKRLMNVFTKRDGESKICLIEGVKDGEKGLKVENPIFVYDEKGKRSEYIEKLYK